MRSDPGQALVGGHADAEFPETIQLCDYVDRAFEEIVAEFESPDAQGLFERTLSSVTGLPAQVRRTQSAVVSRHVARFPMVWRAGEFKGSATLTTIVLHGGNHPITELLMRVEAPEDAAAAGLEEAVTIRLVRDFLEVLTRELAVVIDAAVPAGAGHDAPGADRA